jgi:NAD(P)-dependent dehydrogenase (short-subunit alcohol dehydrogenase family)
MEKVAFISGANRGIGFETAKKLAEKGIKVILGSRDLNKGKEALKKIIFSRVRCRPSSI